MRFYILLMLIFTTKILYGQDRSGDSWMCGYGYQMLNFDTNKLTTSLHVVVPCSESNGQNIDDNIIYDLIVDNSNICDPVTGKLLFVTNGVFIYDTTGHIMPHCGRYTRNFSGANRKGARQVNVILPKVNNQYYVFIVDQSDSLFQLQDNAWVMGDTSSIYGHYSMADKQYVITVDMNARGGLGDVIDSNMNMLNEYAAFGGLYTCRHANGQDWWLLRMGIDSGKVYRWLVSSNEITGPYKQYITNYKYGSANAVGAITFNKLGNKIAIGACTFYEYYLPKILVADFDRCTGLISNGYEFSTEKCGDSTVPELTKWFVNCYGGNDGSVITGLSFSPNSKFLYVAKANYIYQYDLDSVTYNTKPILLSIGIDSFVSTGLGGLDSFYGEYVSLKLGIDNKIYVGQETSPKYMACITKPNEKGKIASAFNHYYISASPNELPCIYPFMPFFNIPNMPDFRMPANYSSCWPSILAPLNINTTIDIYPNPSEDIIYFKTNNGNSAVVKVINQLGQTVLATNLKPINGQGINIKSLPNGFYTINCKFEDGTISNQKFTKR
jgi:Secretion system C-terminal sorting domain